MFVVTGCALAVDNPGAGRSTVEWAQIQQQAAAAGLSAQALAEIRTQYSLYGVNDARAELARQLFLQEAATDAPTAKPRSEQEMEDDKLFAHQMREFLGPCQDFIGWAESVQACKKSMYAADSLYTPECQAMIKNARELDEECQSDR